MAQSTTAQAGRLGGAALATVLLTASTAMANTYYVSPSGSDKADGTLTAPFQTIAHVASLARPGDTISLRAGTYREAVRFARSGLSGAPITLEPYQDEVVTVSGADLVEGWRLVSGSRFEAAMGPSLGQGNDQVFVDHVMAPELAFPHQGADPSSPEFSTVASVAIQSRESSDVTTYDVTLRDPALTQPDHYWQGALIHIHRFAHSWSRWVAMTATIQDSGAGWVSFSYEWKGGDDGEGPISPGNPYSITGKTSGIDQGSFTALSAANEWARDDATGELELVLADPSSHVVEVKHRALAFDLTGTSNIVIRGVGIFAAGIAMDGGSKNNVLQSLTATYVSHFTVINQGATVTGWSAHVADTGIVLDGAANSLLDSTVAFSAGNGVTVGGASQTVQGCIIHDVDYAAVDCAAVYTSGSDHQLLHDTMFNSGRCLVVHRGTANARIEYNELHHAGLQMTDLGATYAYGTDGAGTVIAYNWIHDVDAHEPTGPAAGIYLDNGTRNFLVHHNVVWTAPSGIKVNAQNATSGPSGPNQVYNNTIWNVTWRSIASGFETPLAPCPVENNIFFGACDSVANLDIEHDVTSTAPGFVDAAVGNFELEATSPYITGGLAIPGITDKPSPSYGAYQFGETPWTAGSSLSSATTTSTGSSTTTGSTSGSTSGSTTPASGVRTIQPTEDLAAVLNAATAGQAFELVAGATYRVTGEQAAPRAAGWSLYARGATVDWQIPAKPDAPTACFRLSEPGVLIQGGVWTTNAVLVEMFAPCTVRDLTLMPGATQAVKIDEQFGLAGAGSVVRSCSFGTTSSVTVFSTQPCTIHGNLFGGSVGEVPLRIDCTNPGGVSPSNVIMTNNTIHSVGGKNQKGCVELRQLGTGCQLTGNTFFDYVRVGQGTATSRTEFANGLLVEGNAWPQLPPTVPLDLLLMSGITTVVKDNDFLVNATMQTADIGGESEVTFTGNRRHPSAAGVTPRPDLWDPATVPASSEVTDGGGNVVVPFQP